MHGKKRIRVARNNASFGTGGAKSAPGSANAKPGGCSPGAAIVRVATEVFVTTEGMAEPGGASGGFAEKIL